MEEPPPSLAAPRGERPDIDEGRSLADRVHPPLAQVGHGGRPRRRPRLGAEDQDQDQQHHPREGTGNRAKDRSADFARWALLLWLERASGSNINSSRRKFGSFPSTSEEILCSRARGPLASLKCLLFGVKVGKIYPGEREVLVRSDSGERPGRFNSPSGLESGKKADFELR